MLAALVSLHLPVAPAALAAEFVVTTTVDAVDALPGDGLCADATGECTLRAAIQETNALPGADRIVLPEGEYVLQIPASDETAATGDLDVTDVLEIEGAGAQATVVDGGGVSGVFFAHTPEGQPEAEVSLTLAHVRVRNALGTGVLARRADLAVLDSIVEENTGSGINAGSFPPSLGPREVTIERSEIRSNDGWGVLLSGMVASVVECVIADNGSSGGPNIAGLWADGTQASIERTTVVRNVGPAVKATNTAPDIPESFIADNDVGVSTASASARVTRSTISGNGVGVSQSTFGTAILVDSTVSGNGRGIALGLQAHLIARGSTIANNEEIGIAGVDSLDTAVLSNTILAGNGQDCETGGTGVIESEGHNLIGDSTGCSVVAEAGDQIGAPGSPIDPLLGPLDDNGGPTPTHALLPGSPAIDAGSPDAPGSSESACSATDQRGMPRPRDGNEDWFARCDIGAFEAVATRGCGLGAELALLLPLLAWRRRARGTR